MSKHVILTTGKKVSPLSPPGIVRDDIGLCKKCHLHFKLYFKFDYISDKVLAVFGVIICDALWGVVPNALKRRSNGCPKHFSN